MFDLNVLRPLLLSRGLYPDDVPGLIRYATLGLTNLCWRNSILEDWHAGDGPLSDADMMMEDTVIAHRAPIDGPIRRRRVAPPADHRVMDDEPVDLLQDAITSSERSTATATELRRSLPRSPVTIWCASK
jgi:hypothetical protein